VVAHAAGTVPSSAAAPLPLPSTAWWERVTVKMTGDGEAKNCQYSTSRAGAAAPDCKVVGAGLTPQAASSATPSSAKDAVTTITFERRFSPGGAAPNDAGLAAGEKLLGKEVMALAIDHAGKVSGCRVVDTSGETGLAYGCDEATGETFEASAAATSTTDHRLGFMTILVYGHNEHVV
jgi:hypothetical protein